jgi:hypothetical protein
MEDHGVVSLAHDLGALNSDSGPGKTAMPDPKQHFRISMLKSAVRILACLFFIKTFPISASLLLLAEAIGIIEEMV